MIRFSLYGAVSELETGIGVADLFVAAYDQRHEFDDLLRTAVTSPDGSFEIVSEAADYRDFFERRPDIYIRVLGPDRRTEIWSADKPVSWRVGKYEHFDVRIPAARLGDVLTRRQLQVLGDDGEQRDQLVPGESLLVRARGLRPMATHTLTVADRHGELFRASLITDAEGRIPPTAVWPLVGVEDPRGSERVSVVKARQRWRGAELQLTLREGEHTMAVGEVRLATEASRPLVVATDANGYALHGFDVGEHDARVTLVEPPAWGEACVWMVPRQHEWRAGDPIRPVRLAGGRLASAPVKLGGRVAKTVRVAKADELAPGAYDFIVRQLRYGYADDDDLWLREDDLIGGRWFTGLVVRERFWASKMILGGCVNQQRAMVGRYLGIWPYMAFTNTFQVGENIWAALDPASLDPSLISKMVALYVVPHKTPAQWSVDSSLNNLPVLGGNAAVPRWLTQSWCINANLRPLWPHATQVGEYDVVADFGNNTGDPATFVPDNSFDPPLDLIDGYTDPGFRIIPDPTTDHSFPNSGSFQYDETTHGYVTVAGDMGSNWTVPLKASVRFPSDVPGATSARADQRCSIKLPAGPGCPRQQRRDEQLPRIRIPARSPGAQRLHLREHPYGTWRVWDRPCSRRSPPPPDPVLPVRIVCREQRWSHGTQPRWRGRGDCGEIEPTGSLGLQHQRDHLAGAVQPVHLRALRGGLGLRHISSSTARSMVMSRAFPTRASSFTTTQAA
jgi:hypothetical protein